jgi:hypothetical protein
LVTTFASDVAKGGKGAKMLWRLREDIVEYCLSLIKPAEFTQIMRGLYLQRDLTWIDQEGVSEVLQGCGTVAVATGLSC